MKRIIAHWTAGGYAVNKVDRKHYHRIADGNGNIVHGVHHISDNASQPGGLRRGQYAAHTRKLNTDSIGIAVACMRGAVERPLSYGSSPMQKKQFEAMCKEMAVMGLNYKIPVTATTMLTHAEVQGRLGVAQRKKWDITVLPFAPDITGATRCGNYMRTMIRHYTKELEMKRMPPDVPKGTGDGGVKGLDKPMLKSTTFWSSIVAMVTAAFGMFGGLDKTVQLALLAVLVVAGSWIIWQRKRYRDLERKRKEK